MKLILISGDGIGAGKTTLANRLVGKEKTISLAGALRAELSSRYPLTDWWDKSQEGKNRLVRDPGVWYLRPVREAMLRHGQQQCLDHGADYWARQLANHILQLKEINPYNTFAVDDLRRLVEVNVLRGIPGVNVSHLHVSWASAIYEPEFENAALKGLADYIIERVK